MRWWGWGEDSEAVTLPQAAGDLLQAELGVAGTPSPHARLEEVSLPESALQKEPRERLAATVGSEHVRDDRETRVTHAAGKGYPDLVRVRSGDCSSAPDAVVLPGSGAEV